MPNQYAEPERKGNGCHENGETVPHLKPDRVVSLQKMDRALSGERRQNGGEDRENAGQSRGQCEIGASHACENRDDGSEGCRGEHDDRDGGIFFDIEETHRRDGQRGHKDEIDKQNQRERSGPERSSYFAIGKAQPDRA